MSQSCLSRFWKHLVRTGLSGSETLTFWILRTQPSRMGLENPSVSGAVGRRKPSQQCLPLPKAWLKLLEGSASDRAEQAGALQTARPPEGLLGLHHRLLIGHPGPLQAEGCLWGTRLWASLMLSPQLYHLPPEWPWPSSLVLSVKLGIGRIKRAYICPAHHGFLIISGYYCGCYHLPIPFVIICLLSAFPSSSSLHICPVFFSDPGAWPSISIVG